MHEVLYSSRADSSTALEVQEKNISEKRGRLAIKLPVSECSSAKGTTEVLECSC